MSALNYFTARRTVQVRKTLTAAHLSGVFLIMLACTSLSACTRPAPGGLHALPAPTSNPSASAQAPTPRPTDVVATPGPEPSSTLSLPSERPAAEWNGIPIMSGAVAGRDDGFQYQFTIGGEPEPVLDFYKLALPPLGWELLARGTGYQGEPLMTFLKEGQVLGLSVTPVASEDSLLLVTVSFP